ncbi:DUF4199 domain-containing protein [Pararcticibacter amylolyticus]|uniref:DUF4199 domain-containing protein n=1 Tax=Pararcticibacter amylolyticus TaxID=2173175 RepID=A0A2U2PDS1_9SPHI|nr:DUF4199 domain-containing protein [Pararcticibacter amylolyticus]PWG79269.1 hypothetical protein DDR33_18480 [Pararcticibacter amylolyticus]
METTDIKPNKIAFQSALAYSLYSILLIYVLYFMGVDMNKADLSTGTKVITWLLSYLPFLGAIMYAQKYHRDEQLGGSISFGRAFSTGFRVSLISGLIIGVFMVLYYKVLNTNAFDAVMNATEEAMLNNPSMGDSQRETAMSMTRNWFGPMALVGTIIGMAIVGSILSLIGAAILKKEAPVFIDEVED